MTTNEDEPTTKELRHLARDKMVEACGWLVGRPGMSYAEQLHSLSHAKMAIAEATIALEGASHNVIMCVAEKEIFNHGMAVIEKMLEEAAAEKPETEGETE